MIFKTYSEMQVEVLTQTPNPRGIVSTGLQTCMKKDITNNKVTGDQCQYLISAGHQSPLEHVSMTIYVKGISRSLLAQITRHRTFKFTASSQHYQNYSDYEMVISSDYIYDDEFEKCLMTSLSAYARAIDRGILREEARQLLPNAMAVNLMITADARNMINFFRQRRCLRNVEEMVIFADTWWKKAVQWFPELFMEVGAPCYMTGKCTQGKMKAEICKEK